MNRWLGRTRRAAPAGQGGEGGALPDDLWVRCPKCNDLLYTQQYEDSFKVCPHCGYHFPLSPGERIALLTDPGSLHEMDAGLTSTDPLTFRTDDSVYVEKLANEARKAGTIEAVITGTATLDGMPLIIAVHNYSFMVGSMGIVVGEKITRAIERAADERIPLIIVTATGGARMQESIFSLMQMAKTTAALTYMRTIGAPYITVLTNPTLGGVPASYAMLGDVALAEPGAVIGFAGPRVIEQVTRQKLPAHVDTAEFTLEHGMIDMVVPRADLRLTMVRLLRLLSAGMAQHAAHMDVPTVSPDTQAAHNGHGAWSGLPMRHLLDALRRDHPGSSSTPHSDPEKKG